MRLIYIIAYCQQCGKEWESRNANSIGRKHAEKTGHTVRIEKTYMHYYNQKENNTSDKYNKIEYVKK